MDWLVDAFNWTIPVAGGGLLMREVLGNVFGLASAPVSYTHLTLPTSDLV